MSGRFAQAFELARQVHGATTRRGSDIPYLAHVLGVAALALNDDGTEDEAIAGLLHDAVEDHPDRISFIDIERQFGASVRRIVEACTETAAPTPSPTAEAGRWRRGKAAYLRQIARAPEEARRVILADKIDNARMIVQALRRWGDAWWNRFAEPTPDDLQWYHQELLSALAGWAATPLKDEFRQRAEEVQTRISETGGRSR